MWWRLYVGTATEDTVWGIVGDFWIKVDRLSVDFVVQPQENLTDSVVLCHMVCVAKVILPK